MESGDADAGVVYEQPVDLEEEVSTDAEPLLFLYDCETTGLSIYNDHITDIASKVIACPVSLLAPSFSSLVKTSNTSLHLVCLTKIIVTYTNMYLCLWCSY